jgi:hypothetical protein
MHPKNRPKNRSEVDEQLSTFVLDNANGVPSKIAYISSDIGAVDTAQRERRAGLVEKKARRSSRGKVARKSQ